MTIEQLIDKLSDLGQQFGHTTPVIGWCIEGAAELERLNVSSCEVGTLDGRPAATINLTKP